MKLIWIFTDIGDLLFLCFFRNCLRRIARHDELQFSKDSIVNVMEKFVKTVNVMDETILVPCRLMDRQVNIKFYFIILYNTTFGCVVKFVERVFLIMF